MTRNVLICDSPTRGSELIGQLGQEFELELVPLPRLIHIEPAANSLIDVDLRRAGQISDLHQWVRRQRKNSKIIFAIERSSRFESVQAAALGATGVVGRPIKPDLLRSLLNTKKSAIDLSVGFNGQSGAAQALTVDALRSVFTAAIHGAAPDLGLLQQASAEIVSQLEGEGLQKWLETVRCHHSQTYQHCLIVTAIAVSFGQHLGFSKRDRERLASAGMLHDIGKAKIPLDILEKPTPLSEDEWIIMRMHPELGVQALENMPGFASEMLDIVRYHHELLDGSGYPYGLSGSQISDLVRVITICDVYGALIEKRAYKKPLSGAAAYDVLKGMGPKLDQDMVREFERLTHAIF